MRRLLTIELADDQQAIGALTEIAYSEQSDQLILATDHFMFSAQQWNWGNIGGYMFQELANGQNIFVTSGLGYTYFIEQLPANALGIVKYDEANSRYGLWSSMTYRPILSGCLVQGRYLVLTEVMSAGVFRLNIIQSVSMVFSVGLQYQIPGAVATVSVSCGDDVSSPCLYQGGYDAKGVLILQVPDISQVSFSGLGGMVYACRDLSAQAGDVYQLSRLVRTTSGGLLGLIQITHHGISARYQCFKIDRDESGLGMPRWAVNLDAQPTDIISIGDDEALLCGSDARFDAALGNQAVLMRLSAEGELIEAVRIISLFPTQGRCRLTSAGTRGVAFCIATVLASGKQAMLCGMVKLAPSGLEVLSLPSDVFSVSVSSMNRFNVSFVTLLMTKKSMYLAAMNVGYSLSPSSISVVSIALVSNGVLFAPTQPSASPTVRLTKSPTMLPTWWPTVAPSVPPSFFPSKMPSFWPTFRPTNVGETNIPSVKPSFFPSFWPSMQPSRKPSSAPSIGLTIPPTVALQPTRKPTVCPTLTPTLVPSVGPTKKGETNRPSITIRPSTKPSLLPTLWPSFFPTLFPTQRGATNVPTLPPTPKMIVIIEPGQISSAGAKEAQQPNDMMAVFYGVLGFVGVIVLLIGALLLGIYGLPMLELSYFCVKYKIQPSSFVDKDELIDRFLSERCRHKSIDSRVLASIERIADIFCQRMLTCEEATVDWSVIQILLNHIYDALAIGDVEVGLNGALTEGVIAHIAEVLVTLYISKQVDDMPSAMTEIMLTCTMRLGTIIEEKCDDDSNEGKMSDEVFSSDLSVDTDSSLGEGVHLGVESNRSL